MLLLWWKSRDDGVVGSGVPYTGSPTGRSDFVKELHIGLVIFGPLFRNVVFVVNSFNRTYGFARTAVHTFVRVNVK